MAICIVKNSGLKSNIYNITINTSSRISVEAYNTSSNNYTLNFNYDSIIPYGTNMGSSILSGSARGIVIRSSGNIYNMEVEGKKADENVKISLRCKYIPKGLINGFMFDLILDI